MAKFYGVVGFATDSVDTGDGVWENKIIERLYYGDVLRQTVNERIGDTILPNISAGNSIRIIADPWLRDYFGDIRYVYFHGKNWSVTQVEEKYPFLVLRLGGLYNGPTK